ncbi:MAG: hypothetical protein Kow0029_25130 [Candidatus Rifleibacteriota bacterium]
MKLKRQTGFVLLSIVMIFVYNHLFPIFAKEPDTKTKEASKAANVIRIYYLRSDDNYKNLGLWLWDDFKTQSANWPEGAVPFTGKSVGNGAYVDLELRENPQKLSFLVVNRTTGEKEAGNKVHVMNKTEKELFIRENDDNVYESKDFKKNCKLSSAAIIDESVIRLSFTDEISEESSEFIKNLSIFDRNQKKLNPEKIEFLPKTAIVTLKLDMLDAPLKVVYKGSEQNCEATWQLIDKLYAYDGDDLGCRFENEKIVVKLWAPKAEYVNLLIYDRYDQNKLIGRKAMTRSSGIWLCELMIDEIENIADLTGYYYQFEVKNPGKPPKPVLDPYARSMAPVTVSPDGLTANGTNDFVGKAAFVDPVNIGFEPAEANIRDYQRREDAIIYEVHVRDFTSDPSISADLKARFGTFAAFKSRLSYIKSLGVTHVQLLPVMAWYFGNELEMSRPELQYSSKNNQYNWGYDPQNYFSPDGAYSEKPEDAQLRIAELKDLINAIHEAGMGVILDVVYTHMAKADFLEDIVPDYYFFKDSRGNFLGDFGNNLATTRKMTQKLILDSVKYWFSVYKIDGMRWDMMGDATREAVQNAYNAAVSINPKAIFIGEGWRTFKGHLEDPELAGKGADQDWMAVTDSVGVFSDEMRNELKSGFGCEGEPRFITGGKRNIQRLFNNIKAQPSNTPATSPGDMVQYIAAHDNLPLYDVIAQSIKKDPAIPENDEEIHRRIRIGNALILTSQGTAFIHAGQEFGRSKQWKAPGKPEQKYYEFKDEQGKPFTYPYFIYDSYDSSDAINMFNWKKATDVDAFPINVGTREYTSGLIKLRRSSDAFRLGTKELVDHNVKLISAPEILEEDLIIAYKCMARDRNQFHVFINADKIARKLTLKEDMTQAEVIVDRERSGTNALVKPTGFTIYPDSIEIEPLTVVIFRSKR